MSFQIDIANLENDYGVLKQQASSTSESWDDPVQRKFYEQFVNTLPSEFAGFLNALRRLDTFFESTEQNIGELES